MSAFKTIKAVDFDVSPSRLIGNDWMLITDKQWYADKDYHDLYIGEIAEILLK